MNLKNTVIFALIIALSVFLFSCQSSRDEIVINRIEYKDRLKGFWLGGCIANWTGLPTENRRSDFPFFTDEDFGPGKFDYVLDQKPWGGGNTAARAFYKLKTEYPGDYQRAVSKVVMYNIWYQDGAGNYIEKNHPEVTMIYCGSFAGTWNYNSQKNTYDFIENEVKNNHGPLGALYPQDYVSEGDSPAFLYSIANGLRNHEHPTYGGWGGRFTKFSQFEKVYTDAKDDGDIKKSLRRWVDDANRDFQARMDWCVSSSYEGANHPPVVQITGKKDITVKSGKKADLDAGRTVDPDGDSLLFNWWQYKDAGSYHAMVELQNTDSGRVSFTAPKVSKPETIHIILQVTDNGEPALTRYQRVIVEVLPK